MVRIKKTIKQLKWILMDDQRKPLPRIIFEAIHSGILVKELPVHYFNHLLYKKDVKNYKGYVGFKKAKSIRENFFTKQNLTILNNKRKFSQILVNNKINTPSVLGYSKGRQLTSKNLNTEITDTEHLKYFLEHIAESYEEESIFVKPNDGVNGGNAFKIKLKNDSQKVNYIFNLMESTDLIFQKAIRQHENLKVLNDSSINTVRMHVYYDKGNIEILSGVLRIGRKGAEVDNGHAGGMFVPIDLNTWELKGMAEQHLKIGGRKYEKHPDSNIEFDGYLLPFKEETFDILKKVSNTIQGTIIGWDIAFTPDGPMVIEGNYTFDIFMCQKGCKGFLNHSKYKEIFSSYL